MINISIYEKDNFIRLRYELSYLSSLNKEIKVYTKNSNNEVSKKILEPAIEVFWIKSYDNDKQHYYVSCGTNIMLNSSEKPMENLLEATKKVDLNILGSSLLETLVNDVNSRLVDGKLNEDLIRSVWLDINQNEQVDVVSIEKTIESKIYKKIDTLSFYYPEYKDMWSGLAEEYRLNQLIPTNNKVKTKVKKF